MDAKTASFAKLARSSDRAVSIWGMTITGLATLGGASSLTLICLVIPLLPARSGVLSRSCLIGISLLAYTLGPASLVVAVPVALLLASFGMAAARALISLTAVTLLAHQFQAISTVGWLTIHPGSTGFIILPALVVALSFGPVIGLRGLIALALGAVATVIMIDAGAGRWVNYATFTTPYFRIGSALLPVGVASIFLRPRREEGRKWRGILIGAIAGSVFTLALPVQPVTSISFDEAHGSWETVQAPFGPNDFGRAVNYTYSILFKYAARVVGTASIYESEQRPLPDNGIFVLKMPTQPLSGAFADRLENWVRGGGRLLIVADHTDLYDTSQHLNAFLTPRFGLKINADAVYNEIGMPTVPLTERFAALFGRVDAHGRPMPWQTGTSLASMPVNTVPIAMFGLSYSEPGDYSRQNRFGPFVPRTSLRLTDHLAVAAIGTGRGAIAVILDSTPWSNFSQFMEQYRHLFRGIIQTLERPAALHIWGWGAIALVGFAILVTIWQHPLVMAASGIVLGMTVGASAQIGMASSSFHIEGRDFGLKVVSGEKARIQFLKQLVGPGERNYSRIISAMAKYDLDPLASSPGSEIPDLTQAKRWLLIEPDTDQLPPFDDLISHLQHGGDLTVLFSSPQAASPAVRSWLASMGLYVSKTVGLAVAEDAMPGLLNRNGAVLVREIRALTGALETSLLKNRDADTLLQSYTVRPTELPRISGLLNLGFSADQFSDDAIGEVWEGVQPASLGRHRERQLAAALTGTDFVLPFPDNLTIPSVKPLQATFLPAFVLLDNGKTVISGKFKGRVLGPLSPSENPIGYLADLRDRAVAFIRASCPKEEKRTICKLRLLGTDSIEWMVTWIGDDIGSIRAVELLHERRFSGMGSTINVVFGQ
jgi:hypothetical protein